MGPLYGCSSRPLSDTHRPTLSYSDPPRARAALHRAESDGLAAAAAFAAASFFAVNDTHLPNTFFLSSPFAVFVVKNATYPVFVGNRALNFSVWSPAFHALHHCAAFFGAADGSAA